MPIEACLETDAGQADARVPLGLAKARQDDPPPGGGAGPRSVRQKAIQVKRVPDHMDLGIVLPGNDTEIAPFPHVPARSHNPTNVR